MTVSPTGYGCPQPGGRGGGARLSRRLRVGVELQRPALRPPPLDLPCNHGERPLLCVRARAELHV